MNEYALVLWIWTVGAAVAISGAVYYFANWRYMAEFRHYLRAGKLPESAPIDSIAGGWVRDAIFHLGLRLLLVLLALERVALQLSIPPDQRGAFAASPLQLALAITYLLVLVWITRWTMLIREAQMRRYSPGAGQRP